MNCRFPDEDCDDRYLKQGERLICRLTEWKTKEGICPYNPEIKSKKCKAKEKNNQKLKNFNKKNDNKNIRKSNRKSNVR